MAKRKKTTHRRRSKRGMGGFPKVKGLTSGLMEVAGAVGGAVAASYVTNKLLDKFMPTTPAAKHGAVMVGGLLLDSMMKQPILKNVGKGMAIAGGLNLAKTLVPGIAGITDGDVTSIMEDITLGEDVIAEDVTIGEDVTLGEDLSLGEDY